MEKRFVDVTVKKYVDVVETKEMYVARDGELFDYEIGCKKHEEFLDFDEKFSKIKRIETPPILPFLGSSLGYNVWFRLEDISQYDILKEYVNERSSYKEDLISYNTMFFIEQHRNFIEDAINKESFCLVTIGVAQVETCSSYGDSEIDCEMDIIPLTKLSINLGEIYNTLIKEYVPNKETE